MLREGRRTSSDERLVGNLQLHQRSLHLLLVDKLYLLRLPDGPDAVGSGGREEKPTSVSLDRAGEGLTTISSTPSLSSRTTVSAGLPPTPLPGALKVDDPANFVVIVLQGDGLLRGGLRRGSRKRPPTDRVWRTCWVPWTAAKGRKDASVGRKGSGAREGQSTRGAKTRPGGRTDLAGRWTEGRTATSSSSEFSRLMTSRTK